MSQAAAESVDAFIGRWQWSASAERANYQSFLIGLCKLLGVSEPDPAGPDDRDNAYVFERAVTFDNGDGTTSPGRIDLYKRGCLVLEAKQGSAGKGEDDPNALFTQHSSLSTQHPRKRGTAVRGTEAWTAAMLKAKAQAERYVRALPASEGNPPFVVVVDVMPGDEVLHSGLHRTLIWWLGATIVLTSHWTPRGGLGWQSSTIQPRIWTRIGSSRSIKPSSP